MTIVQQAANWFRLKKNTTNKSRGSMALKKMFIALCTSEEVNKRYHKRSNSESTFAAKKRKFGNFVRSKKDVAKENEEHPVGLRALNIYLLYQ